MEKRAILTSEKGTSAVETAIILPILILLVFGVVQFGIAYNRAQGLQAATREGARLASIGAAYDEIAARVQEAQSLFDDDDVIVTTTPATDPPCLNVGDLVTVNAEVLSPDYAIAIPLFGSYTIGFNASGQFRCERNVPGGEAGDDD